MNAVSESAALHMAFTSALRTASAYFTGRRLCTSAYRRSDRATRPHTVKVLAARLALELCGQRYQVCANACAGSITDWETHMPRTASRTGREQADAYTDNYVCAGREKVQRDPMGGAMTWR